MAGALEKVDLAGEHRRAPLGIVAAVAACVVSLLSLAVPNSLVVEGRHRSVREQRDTCSPLRICADISASITAHLRVHLRASPCASARASPSLSEASLGGAPSLSSTWVLRRTVAPEDARPRESTEGGPGRMAREAGRVEEVGRQQRGTPSGEVLPSCCGEVPPRW